MAEAKEAATILNDLKLRLGANSTIDFERARLALLKSLIRLQVASRARIRS